MQILQNAYKLTVRQRKIFAGLAMAFVITNSQVSAAHAADPAIQSPMTLIDVLVPSAEPLPIVTAKPSAVRTLRTTMTAYNSMPNQTDGSPFVTASGSCVRDGIVASNMFRIGTKVRFPDLFGDKVFVVEDRMNERYTNRVDVWMTSMTDARQFGLKRNVKVEVVEEGDGKKHWNEGWTDDKCQDLINA